MSTWLFVTSLAFSYETDQLTWRERELVDATPEANRIVNALLAEALRRSNEQTRCIGSDEDIRYALAEQIHESTSRSKGVWERKGLRAAGFSVFSAALEESPADKFAFEHREDIYGGLTLWQSFVLTLAGPCSTFEIAGVRLGSDKFDHFLDIGFYYLRDELRTGSLTHALERGTGTERSIYGLLTSKTFSYADLRANYDGYLFYRDLLRDGSVMQRGSDGCVQMIRPFDWSEWVRPEWDEAINTPIYTRLVERGVLRELESRRAEVCDGYRTWGALIGSGSHDTATYTAGPAPAPRDPWQLVELCAPDPPQTLSPAPLRPRKELQQLKKPTDRVE